MSLCLLGTKAAVCRGLWRSLICCWQPRPGSENWSYRERSTCVSKPWSCSTPVSVLLIKSLIKCACIFTTCITKTNVFLLEKINVYAFLTFPIRQKSQLFLLDSKEIKIECIHNTFLKTTFFFSFFKSFSWNLSNIKLFDLIISSSVDFCFFFK